jgi:hypothetical protein
MGQPGEAREKMIAARAAPVSRVKMSEAIKASWANPGRAPKADRQDEGRAGLSRESRGCRTRTLGRPRDPREDYLQD